MMKRWNLRAKRKLLDYTRDGAQPFCMVASFIHPHDTYVARPEWWDLYRDEGIEVHSKPLTEEEVRRAHRACYANISYFDSKIGALVQTVEEMGQLDDNMSIVTADHGDMLGAKKACDKRCFSLSIPRACL